MLLNRSNFMHSVNWTIVILLHMNVVMLLCHLLVPRRDSVLNSKNYNWSEAKIPSLQLLLTIPVHNGQSEIYPKSESGRFEPLKEQTAGFSLCLEDLESHDFCYELIRNIHKINLAIKLDEIMLGMYKYMKWKEALKKES